MKRLARLWLLGLVATIGLTSLGGCRDQPRPPATPAGPKTGGSDAAEESTLPRVLGTLPEFKLTDQQGEVFGTEQLRGKVWIATFIFTRCTATCPAQIEQFARLQRELKKHTAWDKIRLVSFSVDPEYDTVEVLREYAARTSADATHWKFLTGDRQSIWQLCQQGFKLPVQADADNTAQPITHSQRFVLVDESGRIRGYYDGLDEQDRKKLTIDLEKLLSQPAGSTDSLLTWDVAVDEIGGDPNRLAIPGDVLDPPWLEQARQAQLDTVSHFEVFHDFQFTDELPKSGITFINKTVDDAGKSFKAVHYDHGNGLAVADVDGDGLLDIYFTTQLGRNELWRNSGGGKFENWTETSAVGLDDRISVTASFADTDNDGDADLYVTTVRGGNVLFENDGTGKFRDISTAAGLGYVGHSSGAVFFDYNRDGLLDLFLTNVGAYTTDEKGPGGYFVGQQAAFGNHLKPRYSESSILFKNLGDNRFADVSAETSLIDIGWTGDASPLDLNQDGWPDLYVLNMQGHDEYYENDGGKRFVRKSRDIFPATPWGAMGIGVFDYNNNGRMDIFITDMHTDMFDPAPFREYLPEMEKAKLRESKKQSTRFLATDGNHVLGNAFYRNDGDGTFKEISGPIGAENYWPWGLSVGDLNADGFEDVFITASMNYTFRYGVNSLLLNNRGENFLDSEFVLGVEPRRGGRTAKLWFELECSGDDRDHSLCQGREGRVEVWGALGSRSSAIFDLDNDGDLDIVTNDFNSEPMVLVSNLTEQKPIRYLKIGLVGKRSSRDALGTKVVVTTDAQTLTKVYDGKSGYLSQSRYPLYFGLDKAETIRRIEVFWPAGEKQLLEGPIEANRLIEVEEPEKAM